MIRSVCKCGECDDGNSGDSKTGRTRLKRDVRHVLSNELVNNDDDHLLFYEIAA